MAPERRVQFAASFCSCLCPQSGQRVEFCSPVVFTGLPLRRDPAFLFQFVEGGIKRSIAYLQDISRNLFQTLANRPAIERFQRQNLQQKQVQCSLYEVRWSAHVPPIGY